MSLLKWSYRPYVQYRYRFLRKLAIVSIRPGNTSFSIEIMDTVPCDFKYKIIYRERGTEEWLESQYIQREGRQLDNLKENTDYEFYVKAIDGFLSETRLVRTGVPDCYSIVNYLHPEDEYFSYVGKYLGSPSIVRLKSGKLLASHDYFSSGSPMCITSIFQSVDNAKTWTYLCDLMPCEWSYMFTIENRLYMFGLSREYGDILISESKDEGKTWLNPTVIERGLGSGSSGFHRAPCKHLIHNGRIWLAVENGSWSDNGFAQCLISASIDDDLLDSNSWTITEPALFKNSLIEGTPFVGDDQNMYVMYRCGINRGYILKANASRPQDKLELSSVINIPFGHSKFELIKNSDGIFYAIGNEAINNKGTRHVLSLYKSSNCKEWEKVKTLIDYSNLDEELCGFQYPSCIIENNKLTIMIRTSYNGAHTFHDSNMMLIYKFEI